MDKLTYKYGTFKQKQIEKTKEKLRKQIFFLLLIADPKTADNYDNVDVVEAFKNVQYMLDGYSSLVEHPQEVVTVASLLEEALINYIEHFDFRVYRKLVLDAGYEVSKIKEVDDAEP